MGGNRVLFHHVTQENFHVNCCEEEEEDDDDEEGVMNIQTGLAGWWESCGTARRW